MSNIVKSSLVEGFVSIFRATLKFFVELLNSRSIFLLIVGGIFAHSPFLIDLNITSGYYVEEDKQTISLWDVNDKCNSIFMKEHNIFLINKMNTNEVHRRVKVEFIKKQHSLYYNQAPFNIAGITFPLPDEQEERSDLFYYILGIIILIVSAFILRQRYKQYLEEKNKLNR
ncbi:MAG: hypothetical protein ACW99A_19290 [Candidatus Kariarchaeaceae archaeon]